MRFPKPRRATISIAVSALIAAASGMVMVPSAHAGDYAVSYCVRPDGTPVGQLPDIQFEGTQRPGSLTSYGCNTPDGGIQFGFIGEPDEHSAGEYARATITTSGAGMSIAGASADGYYVKGPWDVTVGPITTLSPACTTDSPACNVPREFSGQWTAPTSEAELDRLSLQIACNQPACNGGSTLVTKHLTVTYRDVAPPAGGSAEGVLVNSAPGAPVSGQASVKISAADTGAGMQYGSVRVDGAVIASSPAQCSTPYDRQHPCPVRLDKEVSIDSARLANGTHTLEVTATDAAGNTSTVSRSTLIVDNGGARGPGVDVNLRGVPIGSYGADDARLQAWWPATARKPSSKRSTLRSCRRSKAYRRRHAVACNGRPASRRLRVGYSSRKQNIVRGRLTTPSGAAVAGARIDILATPSSNGASARPVATLLTDAGGRFEQKIPVASGSATYIVGWIARARDTAAATTTTLKRTVRAGTTFRASPRRAVRRGRPLVFTGRLRGTEGSRQGNAVAIQANAGNGWRAVKTVRTRDDGGWVVRYRVPVQLRGRYLFRAVVVPSAGYPYASAASATRPVVVR